nr:hypothetical protein [Acinetobacter sp.]
MKISIGIFRLPIRQLYYWELVHQSHKLQCECYVVQGFWLVFVAVVVRHYFQAVKLSG